MNTLISINVNQIFHAKNDEETEFEKFHELVFLVDQPAYSLTNSGEVVRERKVDDVRIVVSDANLGKVIEHLQRLRSAKQSDLS